MVRIKTYTPQKALLVLLSSILKRIDPVRTLGFGHRINVGSLHILLAG
jgi:hypothetical protein